MLASYLRQSFEHARCDAATLQRVFYNESNFGNFRVLGVAIVARDCDYATGQFAYERLPLAQIEDVEPLVQLQRRGLKLYGCLAAAKRTMYEADLAGPTIIAIGGEKRGLSGAVRSICDQFITVPTTGGPSSLSLSHAAAILLAETLRQRRG